jgi:pimeloyl-ACP methyl ester carboxylesterase
METASINGTELQYTVTGSGEPVLLIAMGPCRDGFLPLLSESVLANRYRLISYRQRRIARGAADPTPVSFAQHAADAAELLGKLGVRRAHVAGHSSGAAIALQMAVDHPDRVGSLALLEPPLVGVPSAAAFFTQLQPAFDAFGAGDREGAMTRFMSVMSGLDWDSCRAQVDKYLPGGATQALKDADNFFGSYLAYLNAWQFGADQAAAIAQPALSVVGAQSVPFFTEGHELLHRWIPQLESCVVDGVGHLLHLQNPQPIARCMAEFFARHPLGEEQRRTVSDKEHVA